MIYMFKTNNMEFVAEVSHVWDKTRFKDSMFMCTILKGQINKGDVVQLLDKDGDFITEQEINLISHSQQAFDSVNKDDAPDNIITLTFKHIWEYPVNSTKYIVKMNNLVLSEYKSKPDILLPVNNEYSYNRLITKTIDIDEFVKQFYIYPLSTNLGYYFLDIYHGIGIECLRETETGALYSVHMVKQGGLLYIFYARLKHSAYVKVTGWYYVKNKLASDDFKEIKKGSKLSDVIAIDSVTQIYENIYNSNPFLFNLKEIGLDTYHFLTDGILKFHFSYIVSTVDGGELQVVKKKFATFDDIKSIQTGESIYSLSGRILPIDYID